MFRHFHRENREQSAEQDEGRSQKSRLNEREFREIESNFLGPRQNRDCDFSVNHFVVVTYQARGSLEDYVASGVDRVFVRRLGF